MGNAINQDFQYFDELAEAEPEEKPMEYFKERNAPLDRTEKLIVIFSILFGLCIFGAVVYIREYM